MQNSALVRRINNVLAKRLLRHLEDMAKNEPKKFDDFINEVRPPACCVLVSRT